MSELNFLAARVLAGRLRSGDLAAVDVMSACLDQIERFNPEVNAIPTLRPRDELLREARLADQVFARNEAVGSLHGLPIAVKDLARTKGLRTTFGSKIFENFVPDEDELFVQRLKQAGAIIIGKTNTPEFGAGSQTFNTVFGSTKNPYDLTRTCGGSSGGAAVAVACGMLPFADGSDFGGSLRNPASFCNVVGFRPSPGRVPRLASRAWYSLPVSGPIARNVADAALLLSAMAGPDDRDPISLAEHGGMFLQPLEHDFNGTRIAWSDNLGCYPIEPIVTTVCNASRSIFADLDCIVEEAEPDISGADNIFQTLRAAEYAFAYGDLLATNRDLMKDTVVWNIEQGMRLSAHDVMRAESEHTLLGRRVTAFMEHYEFLILPVVQVPPFPLEMEWVREINASPMHTYLDWMGTCYAISCTGLPAISIPCGFTIEGLPIGLQIVGRRHHDLDVLKLAYAFEQATRYGETRPQLVSG